MLYDDYLVKISKRFEARFDEIDPHWNFDAGHEFEIALATTIDELLPDKYGVCRGFAVAQNGQKSGDDIIIYDRQSAPLLRPGSEGKFLRKEEVPIESIFAYIEAKNTIELTKQSSGTYIGKAIEQVKGVKALPRERRSLENLIDSVTLDPRGFQIPRAANLPGNLNPMYTMVFSRGIRINGKITEDSKLIHGALAGLGDWGIGPDLLVLGKNNVELPVAPIEGSEGGVEFYGPFVIEGKNESFISVLMNDYAFGFGVAALLFALQRIQLNPMPWDVVTQDGVAHAELITR